MKLQDQTLRIPSDAPKKLALELLIQTRLTTTITSVRIAIPVAPRAEPLTLVSRAQTSLAS